MYICYYVTMPEYPIFLLNDMSAYSILYMHSIVLQNVQGHISNGHLYTWNF